MNLPESWCLYVSFLLHILDLEGKPPQSSDEEPKSLCSRGDGPKQGKTQAGVLRSVGGPCGAHSPAVSALQDEDKKEVEASAPLHVFAIFLINQLRDKQLLLL